MERMVVVGGGWGGEMVVDKAYVVMQQLRVLC